VGDDATGLTDGRRIQRTAAGAIELRFPAHERALLREIAAAVRLRLRAADDDPDLRRLFPPAYEDAEREREYRDLTRAQLVDGRDRALAVLEATVDQPSLSAEEADGWLRALNDARLVIGTALDVQEDLDWEAIGPENPQAQEYAIYGYLSWIQEQLVEAAEL
jgi:Domain of unknown function (DUF2017)